MTLETKIQIEALKALEKNKYKPAFAEDENFVYLTVNGYYVYRIPKQYFYLNRDSINHNTSFVSSFSPIMLDKACRLTVTDTMQKLENGKVVTVLKADKFNSYISSDHLKLLTLNGCELYAKSEKSAICFVAGGDIYAICMPVMIRKAD